MKKYDGYAIVTGGARGMGAAICRQLAKDGYDIVCNYVSDSSLAKVEALAAEIAEKYGRKVIAAQGNVAKYNVFLLQRTRSTGHPCPEVSKTGL